MVFSGKDMTMRFEFDVKNKVEDTNVKFGINESKTPGMVDLEVEGRIYEVPFKVVTTGLASIKAAGGVAFDRERMNPLLAALRGEEE